MNETPDFERFLTSINLEEPDRVPLAELGVDEDIKKAMLRKEHLSLVDNLKFYVKSGMDYIRVLADGRDFNIGSTRKFYRYSLYANEVARDWAPEHNGLIKSLEDLESFPFPELSNINASTARELRKILDKTYPKMGLIAGFGDVFTRTWQLLGFSRFCRCLYATDSDRKLVEKLFEKIERITLYECKVLIEAGVDAVWPSDDIAHINGPIVHPDFLRRLFFPWLKRVGEMAKKYGLPVIYHSDGNLEPIMEDILNCHVDALHPIEPKAMDILKLKEKWGSKIAFIGNIDLNTLSLGSVEDVVQEVKEKIAKIAPGGGYAVGSSNTVTHYVKLENYEAMIATTKRRGKYPIKI